MDRLRIKDIMDNLDDLMRKPSILYPPLTMVEYLTMREEVLNPNRLKLNVDEGGE